MPHVCDVPQRILTTCDGQFQYVCGFRWVKPPRCWFEWKGWTPKLKCTPGTVEAVWCTFNYQYPCFETVEVPGWCFDCAYTRYIRVGVLTFEVCCEDDRELLLHRVVGLRAQSQYCFDQTLKHLGEYTDIGKCTACQDTPDPLPGPDNPLGNEPMARSVPRTAASAEREARQPETPFGLGDVVKAVLSRVGFKACEPCERRRAWLNAKVPLSRDVGGVLDAILNR